MAKVNGTSVPGEYSLTLQPIAAAGCRNNLVPQRQINKVKLTKLVNERRRNLSKIKDSFSFEQRKAVLTKNEEYLAEVMRRWDQAHERRYIISPHADCFYDMHGNLNHGSKPRFVKCSTRDNRDVCYPFNTLKVGNIVSKNLYSANMSSFFSVQIDIMNARHYRGGTGEWGTSLMDVVTGKMKNVLKSWINAVRAKALHQIHLHIGDPSLLIRQKATEQYRRDRGRFVLSETQDLVDETSLGEMLGFQDEICLPWSSLLINRSEKDEMASLHMFCAGVAAFELLNEHSLTCSVFMHGGRFAVDTMFTQSTPQDYYPSRYDEKQDTDESLRGSVILKRITVSSKTNQPLFCIPRSRCLIFEQTGKESLGMHVLKHGESETRFVATFENYVEGPFMNHRQKYGLKSEMDSSSMRSTASSSATLIVSDDTDVFIILLCNK